MNANPLAKTGPPRAARLIEPAVQMAQAYGKFLQEFIDAGEEGALFTVPAEVGDAAESIRCLQDHARGINLPEDWVSATACWLLSDQEVLLGEIHIRHRLTPALEVFGGHIGYMIRPSERGKGYGTMMLALGLEKALSLGLRRVLVTCDPANAASARVIQKNGGKLAVEPAGNGGRLTLRYWIEL